MNLLLALLILAPQEPSFDRIDHGKPEKYLDPPATLGKEARLREIAAPLKKKTAEQTVRAIGEWIGSKLKYDPKVAYAWRNVEKVIDDAKYGGCADHALVFGALARACGIPTAWVKTMDADWIHEFRADPDGFDGTWSGHVFLEVHIGGAWRLLDASAMVIYDAYDPKSRILPGTRYAYDKGGDPYELVLSVRWEDWKRQTRAYFRTFDLGLLPPSGGRPLNRAYIAANSPVWQMIHERCDALGVPPSSFNCEFDQRLRAARGGRLVLTCVGDALVLPEKYHKSHSPMSVAEIQEALKTKAYGSARRTLEDGTSVILLFGRTVEDIKAAVAGLTFE
jgi:hypothetical protein